MRRYVRFGAWPRHRLGRVAVVIAWLFTIAAPGYARPNDEPVPPGLANEASEATLIEQLTSNDATSHAAAMQALQAWPASPPLATPASAARPNWPVGAFAAAAALCERQANWACAQFMWQRLVDGAPHHRLAARARMRLTVLAPWLADGASPLAQRANRLAALLHALAPGLPALAYMAWGEYLLQAAPATWAGRAPLYDQLAERAYRDGDYAHALRLTRAQQAEGASAGPTVNVRLTELYIRVDNWQAAAQQLRTVDDVPLRHLLARDLRRAQWLAALTRVAPWLAALCLLLPLALNLRRNMATWVPWEVSYAAPLLAMLGAGAHVAGGDLAWAVAAVAAYGLVYTWGTARWTQHMAAQHRLRGWYVALIALGASLGALSVLLTGLMHSSLRAVALEQILR